MRTFLSMALALCTALPLSGCVTAAEHRAAVQDDSAERLTVGTVQKKIRVGMAAADVVAALGSPNIVTTDENRREVWVYDKIATDRAFSTSEGGFATLIIGPFITSSAGASSTSQRTLTVIIKYDEQMKVRDFAYHTSRF